LVLKGNEFSTILDIHDTKVSKNPHLSLPQNNCIFGCL
jgi:hypothetical protein